jgi:hypothetical protein
MESSEKVIEQIPYAVSPVYAGGIQCYVGELMYCDLIGRMVTPETDDALEARLLAEASAVLGQEAHIVDIVPCWDMAYGEVLRVFFEPVWSSRPACHLCDLFEEAHVAQVAA